MSIQPPASPLRSDSDSSGALIPRQWGIPPVPWRPCQPVTRARRRISHIDARKLAKVARALEHHHGESTMTRAATGFSLPMSAACRATKLSDLLVRREEGKRSTPRARAGDGPRRPPVVGKQAAAGIDIANDGEQQRVGFQTYVPQRMSGFAGESKRRRGRDFEEFPELVALLMQRFPSAARAECSRGAGRAALSGHGPIEQEIARLQPTPASRHIRRVLHDRALARDHLQHDAECFYDSQEAYLDAIAREMRNEYLAIHKAGLLLQIDSPDLAMDRSMFYRDLSDARVCEGRRDARRGDQQGHRRHPARPRAAALLLGQLGRSAHPRRCAGADSAGAVPGQRRRAQHRIRQSAASHEYAALRRHPCRITC